MYLIANKQAPKEICIQFMDDGHDLDLNPNFVPRLSHAYPIFLYLIF